MDLIFRKKTITKVEEVDIQVMSFSKKDIEEILRKNLREKGYVPQDMKIIINWQYGQGNEVVVTEFDSIEIEVK